MLTLELGESDELENSIFGDVGKRGEKVLLLNDGNAIGIAEFGLTNDNTVVLYRVGIVKEERGRNYGDFFTRSMLFKLGLGGLDIEIPYLNDYYTKFGFVCCGKVMRASADKLFFPSGCKCKGV